MVVRVESFVLMLPDKKFRKFILGRLPYACECCNVRFRWQVSLRLHSKRCQAAVHQKKRKILKRSPAKNEESQTVIIVEPPPVESPSANIMDESPPEPQPPAPAVDQPEQQQPEPQHHPEPVYKCEKKNCNEVFNSSISLARHSRVHPSKSSFSWNKIVHKDCFGSRSETRVMRVLLTTMRSGTLDSPMLHDSHGDSIR